MSSLDKLAIRGIRSFDHKELSVMQFYTPLTVIVGHNGSGKTTIIECLKYATTGDLPPNTKGGAFVHDPSIAGTSEVKAQVKLRFNNIKNEKMLVERRLEVKKKKNVSGLAMKTLEATISKVDKDEDTSKRRSLSTKCASLDEEISYQLGVSKAILENVIFCHQEESNWPLSEPAALKKKFDDIFEATKYTKALDQIKTLRKEQGVEIKVDKAKLDALKQDRDRATRLRKYVQDLEVEIEAKEADRTALEEEVEQLVAANTTFFNQATKYQDIIGKVETLRERKGLVEDNLTQLRASLTELNDSDAELNKKVANHEDSLQQLRTEREGIKQKMGDESDSLAAYERKRSQAQTKHGSLLAQKERHSETLKQRQTLVHELGEKHGIPGYAGHNLSEDEIAEFEQKMEDAIRRQTNKIETIKADSRKQEGERQNKIQQLKSDQAADDRARRSTLDQIRAANTRIASLARTIESKTISEADITYQESTLAEDKRHKAELEASIKTADYPAVYRVKGKELKEEEEKREGLHAELGRLNAQANVRARLQLRKSEKTKKDESIDTLITKSSSAFNKLLRTQPTRENMEPEINGKIITTETEISAAETTHRNAARELQRIETALDIAKKKVKSYNETAENNKAQIAAKLTELESEEVTVEAAIKDAQQEVDFARGEVAAHETYVKFYKTVLDKGKKNHVCIGCNRGLADNDMGDFEAYCKRKQERAPADLAENKKLVAAWEKQLVELKRLLPLEMAFSRLSKDEIPAAERELDEEQRKLGPATTKAGDAAAELSAFKTTLQDLQALKRSAVDVARFIREMKEIDRDIVKLEGELQASGSTKTSEEVQASLSEAGEKIRKIKAELDKTRSEHQAQNAKIQTYSNSIHTAEMELATKRQDIKDREQLEQRQASERAEVVRMQAELKELEGKLETAMSPIRKLEDELAQLRAEFVQQEKVASGELQSYNKSAERLDSLKREITKYERQGTEAQLTQCERDLEKHNSVIVDTKARIATLQNRISAADKQLSDSNAVLRNFSDNLRLRSEKKNLASIVADLDALDEENARKMYRQFEAQYTEKRQRQTDKQGMQAKLGGEIETKKGDLATRKKELADDFKDIENRYKTELVKLKTTEMANDDLQKYSKALDAAIMRFHSMKMAEINDTISDLWTKTYQGTDIDKIMIKSDAEGKIAGTKASYNYRVVMYKDTTEMDMRGRCSAGQKVLASIIIRLALAESFGVNCGIMALDEPTTNLDHDNILALAAALSDLIKERKSQANFQLIVITHDESFLEILGGSGVLDKYFRVSRGDGGQVSKIERQRLT